MIRRRRGVVKDARVRVDEKIIIIIFTVRAEYERQERDRDLFQRVYGHL